MGKIQQSENISGTDLRKDAIAIFDAGLDAIDTKKCVREAISLKDGVLCVGDTTCSIQSVERVFFIGVGKCARHAAEVVEEKIGAILAGGIALDVDVSGVCTTQKIECIAGTHPEPSIKNIEVSRRIVALLSDLTERDAVIVVVSGGGSTLLCLPEHGNNTCVEEHLILETLFRKGAPIEEINTIRKHMSEARGGFLAKHAYPAQVFGLLFSDVPSKDISMIASGPTVKDATTVADADAILKKYEILRTCGIEHCGLIETPKDDKYFVNVKNTLLVSNTTALTAMQTQAESLGYAARIVTDTIRGEAREVGVDVARAISKEVPGTVLLYGGETTVTITGDGRGGRNQECVLAALDEIRDEVTLVASIASDGHDNGVYAGAIADSVTLDHAEKLQLDVSGFFEKNNTQGFFEQTKDHIVTGHTGSNVADLLVAIKK